MSRWRAIATWLCAPMLAGAQPLDLARYHLIDLTHEVSERGPAWPGSRVPFKLDTLTATATTAMFRLQLNEHFGTHLDAPRHAAGAGWTNEQIPLDRLVVPVVVIDVTRQAASTRDYALTPADVATHEAQHGRIPRGSAVLLRTGWARFWGDDSRYYGAVTTAARTVLHFPSFGIEAARLLTAERGAAILGVDSPSTDIGAAPSFAVHAILGAANVPALENLADLSNVPATGATLIALPIKTTGGSGGPVRVVALVPR